MGSDRWNVVPMSDKPSTGTESNSSGAMMRVRLNVMYFQDGTFLYCIYATAEVTDNVVWPVPKVASQKWWEKYQSRTQLIFLKEREETLGPVIFHFCLRNKDGTNILITVSYVCGVLLRSSWEDRGSTPFANNDYLERDRPQCQINHYAFSAVESSQGNIIRVITLVLVDKCYRPLKYPRRVLNAVIS